MFRLIQLQAESGIPRISVAADSVSPEAVASWNLRMAVFSEDFTDLLRIRRFSFCRLRLIWDLMFATRQPCPDSM